MNVWGYKTTFQVQSDKLQLLHRCGCECGK